MDDQQSGSCPCCGRRDPRQGFACGPCRSRMRAWLSGDDDAVPDLWERLLAEPMAREGGSLRGGPVSGSRERQLPIRVDVFDLTHAGGWPAVLDEDQVGHVPVWSTLAWCVESWAALRGRGEHGPARGDVGAACGWLRERVDEVADEAEEFADVWHTVRKLRGALQALLGIVDVPDYKRGVPCRQCGALTLVHHAGSGDVECTSCPALLTLDRFDEWVRQLAAAVKKMEKAA